MKVFYSTRLKGYHKVSVPIDKDEKRLVEIQYIPATWQASTVYNLYETILPTVFKGKSFFVTSSGKSAGTEPTWINTVGLPTTGANGEPSFKAREYDGIGTSLTISSSTFTPSNGVTVTSVTATTTKTSCLIDSIPAGVDSFTLKNHIVLNNGEEVDFSLEFKVNER